MIIERAENLSLSSSRVFEQEHVQQRSLEIQATTANRPDETPRGVAGPPRTEADPQRSLSGANETTDFDKLRLENRLEVKARILQKMLEALTGKKHDFPDATEFLDSQDQDGSETATVEAPPTVIGAPPDADGGGPQFGVRYTEYEKYREFEETTFQAEGVIQTADGREIDFEVDLTMSREFVRESRIDLRAGVMKDPLVIQLDGSAPELTDEKLRFDLDADGLVDEISFIRPGGGFLALDRDGDGVIQDGRELFGPQTGDGFSELAEHDRDGNGFIDEADDVFDRLSIWTLDSGGDRVLTSLRDAGVGAISLDRIATPFQLRSDTTGETAGQVRSSGFFLHENGLPGTVHHLDLTV